MELLFFQSASSSRNFTQYWKRGEDTTNFKGGTIEYEDNSVRSRDNFVGNKVDPIVMIAKKVPVHLIKFQDV